MHNTLSFTRTPWKGTHGTQLLKEKKSASSDVLLAKALGKLGMEMITPYFLSTAAAGSALHLYFSRLFFQRNSQMWQEKGNTREKLSPLESVLFFCGEGRGSTAEGDSTILALWRSFKLSRPCFVGISCSDLPLTFSTSKSCLLGFLCTLQWC